MSQNRQPITKLASAVFRYGVPAELGVELFEKVGDDLHDTFASLTPLSPADRARAEREFAEASPERRRELLLPQGELAALTQGATFGGLLGAIASLPMKNRALPDPKSLLTGTVGGATLCAIVAHLNNKRLEHGAKSGKIPFGRGWQVRESWKNAV